MTNKKRKFSELKNKPDLTLQSIESLPCQCCNTPVKEYKLCSGNMIYCSEDCMEVLILSKTDMYLDENMKQTQSFFNALNEMEMHIDEKEN